MGSLDGGPAIQKQKMSTFRGFVAVCGLTRHPWLVGGGDGVNLGEETESQNASFGHCRLTPKNLPTLSLPVHSIGQVIICIIYRLPESSTSDLRTTKSCEQRDAEQADIGTIAADK